jgi:peptide/nickel transport system permease protein
MSRYLLRRALQSALLLAVVSLVVFAMILTAPGGPSILMDPNMGAEEAARMRALLGLDQPVHVQYLKWLASVLRGNLGMSLALGRPVLELIGQSLPATLLLSGASLLIAIAGGVPAGIVSARWRNSWLDRGLTFGSVFGLSVPVFWYGLMLIIVLSVRLNLLPPGGMYTLEGELSAGDVLKHLLMPAFVLGTVNMAQIARYARSSILSVLQQDYVRTGRAKGLHERALLFRHALRNALIPVVTLIGLLVPRLVGGAAVTESVFTWPGMGRLAVSAAFQRDYATIMGVTLIVSGVVILSNLLTDIAYVFIDPRVRYE